MPHQPSFYIHYIDRTTGRERKDRIRAGSEEEVRALVTEWATEIFSIEHEPDDPATERQLAYADSLGIDVPDGSTKSEVSDMIDFALNNDRPPSIAIGEFANRYGVEFTMYTGKKALFDRIFSKLQERGRERDLAAWFTYRVYRGLVNGRYDVPIKSPYDPLIQNIANEVVQDDKVLRSIRRYENGRYLIWFGQWTSPDGWIHQGGSTSTIAYRCVAGVLRRHLEAQEQGSHPVSSEKRRTGCIVLIIILIIIIVKLLMG